MQYLKTYLNKIIERGNTGLAESIAVTAEDVGSNYLKHFSFTRLLEKGGSKTYIIVSFLAILELMKTGVLVISQEQPFDDIIITCKENKQGD